MMQNKRIDTTTHFQRKTHALMTHTAFRADLGPIIIFAVIVVQTLFFCETKTLSQQDEGDVLFSESLSHGTLPQHVHIAYGASSRNIVIMWATEKNATGYVQYRCIDDLTLSKVNARMATLEKRSENALKYLYRTELLDLQLGLHYTYKIVSFSSKSHIESKYFKFKIPHGNPTKNHTFMIVADMGLYSKSLHFVAHEALVRDYDTVFHVGDIAYDLDSNSGAEGDQYLSKVELFTSQVPYMTTPGNHEAGDQFYHYRHRFSMPQSNWPMQWDSLWYSMDIGQTHFVSINTETLLKDSIIKDKQLAWLMQDLMAANKNRSKHPWIIVMGHTPLYCTKTQVYTGCSQEYYFLRKQLEDIFYKEGVDVYISGHKHIYERSWPMYKGKAFQTDTINPIAPIYIILGTLGYEYIIHYQLSKPFWLAFSSSGKELYGRLQVWNSTHMTLLALAAESNEQVDKMHVIQTLHGSFGAPGESVFKKLTYRHQRDKDLPPEPFIIVDAPMTTMTKYRKHVLYCLVLSLSFILFLFLRNPSLHRLFRRKFDKSTSRPQAIH